MHQKQGQFKKPATGLLPPTSFLVTTTSYSKASNRLQYGLQTGYFEGEDNIDGHKPQIIADKIVHALSPHTKDSPQLSSGFNLSPMPLGFVWQPWRPTRMSSDEVFKNLAIGNLVIKNHFFQWRSKHLQDFHSDLHSMYLPGCWPLNRALRDWLKYSEAHS